MPGSGYGYDYLPDAPDYLNEGNVVFRVSESSYVLDGDGLPEGITCGLSACVDANGNIVDFNDTNYDLGPDPGADDLDLDGSGGGGGGDDDDYLGLNFYDDEGNFDLNSQDYA